MNLDATDRALLSLLSEDARVSHRSLARTLGIAQGTVTNRVRRLEQEGVIEGYRVALNPTQLGWSMTIMAGLRIQKGRMIDVQQKISADPRVFAVYDVTGDWDSIVLARVKDRADLEIETVSAPSIAKCGIAKSCRNLDICMGSSKLSM